MVTWDPPPSIAARLRHLHRKYPGYNVYAIEANIADGFHHVPVHALHFGGGNFRSPTTASCRGWRYSGRQLHQASSLSSTKHLATTSARAPVLSRGTQSPSESFDGSTTSCWWKWTSATAYSKRRNVSETASSSYSDHAGGTRASSRPGRDSSMQSASTGTLTRRQSPFIRRRSTR